METLRVVSTPCGESEACLLPRASRPWRSRGVRLADPLPTRNTAELAEFLLAAHTPVLLVRAGAWPVAAVAVLPTVAGDSLLMGVSTGGKDGRRWQHVLATTGGNLRTLPWWMRWRGLPLPPLCLLGANVAVEVARFLKRGLPLEKTLHRMVFMPDRNVAAIHPSLRCAFDPTLRIMQAVTSIQRGGAERVCLDQAAWIERSGIMARTVVAVLGRPGRAAWEPPSSLIDLSSTPAQPAARADALSAAADTWGADAAHVHLLSAATTSELKRRGVPVMVTLHNQPVAWPTGTLSLPPLDQADLFLGCSRLVADSIKGQFGSAAPPTRALPNGVQHHPLTAATAAAARKELRAGWGCDERDVVLLAVANPRPQKRLEALPEIAAHAAALDPQGRRFRVVVAGSPGAASAGGAEAMDALRKAQAGAPPGGLILLGDVARTAPVLAAADVLVCCSRHEGLSLSWLEALREGLPVASAQVGAAVEVESEAGPALQLAPAGDDRALAAAVLRALDVSRPALPPSYTARAMAIRATALSRRLVGLKARAAHRRPAGVWIVTCNLALGGAQSSCRRLLHTLRARGIPARCAVVEENPAHPTRGVQSLRAAGIPTHCIPPARPTAQALELLARLDADPPEAVLFWNLPPVMRVLLADLGLDAARMIDVSPGEMSFRSLRNFFEDPASRAGLPYPDTRAYGRLLHGAVVKFAGEAATAADTLGCPVTVIPNGVPLPSSPCPRPMGNRSGAIVFGTAVRLSPDKCLEELFDGFRLAFPSLPSGSRLLVAGEADSSSARYTKALRRRCAGLPVDFLGRLDGESLATRFHRQVDVFVMISRPAGCPNASLEAMAAGLPVIATDWGGAREQVIAGVTGLLAPDNDPAALAEAMVRLSRSPDARRSMAAAGRKRIRAEFSLERMADSYLRFCEIKTVSDPTTPHSQSLRTACAGQG